MPEDKFVTVSELNVALDRQRDQIIDRLLQHVGKQREGLLEHADRQREELLEHADRQRQELLERIEKTETTLLKEFRKWAISFETRFKANEILVNGFNERLVSLEERVSDLESGEE